MVIGQSSRSPYEKCSLFSYDCIAHEARRDQPTASESRNESETVAGCLSIYYGRPME